MSHDEIWRSYRPVEVEFGGTRYRSRLEARWAAFFSDLGWQYHYEPQKFPRWSPDFVLYGPAALVFVEVKPIPGRLQAMTKVEGSLPRHDLQRPVFGLVVCEEPLYGGQRNEVIVGDAFGWDGDGREWCWGEARLVTRRRQHPIEFDLHWATEDTCLLAVGNETSGNVITVDSWTATVRWSSAWQATRYLPRIV